MAQMSKKFREMGGEVYVDAERVKKSSEALREAPHRSPALSSSGLPASDLIPRVSRIHLSASAVASRWMDGRDKHDHYACHPQERAE
jgi:hypothetical protein